MSHSQPPDWSRWVKSLWSWHPACSLVPCIRGYQRQRGCSIPISRVERKLAVISHNIWSGVTVAEIPLSARLDGGLSILHFNGIVFHPEAVVGANGTLFQQGTLGLGSCLGLPVLGDGVEVGAGAKILGGVTIGSGARVDANAVLLTDVPTGATSAGVWAKVWCSSGTGP